MVFPRPAEARAQRLVRGLNVAKAARSGMRIWVGRDSEGVAAVAAWKWIEPGIAMVHVVALSLRVRGNGFLYTDELVDTASAQVAGEAADRGLSEVKLVAYIHENNRASRAFAKRFEMEEVSEAEDDGYILHSVTLAFAEAEEPAESPV